jgi:hypothetical protein
LAVTIAGTASKLRIYQPMASQISSGTIAPIDLVKSQGGNSNLWSRRQ